VSAETGSSKYRKGRAIRRLVTVIAVCAVSYLPVSGAVAGQPDTTASQSEADLAAIVVQRDRLDLRSDQDYVLDVDAKYPVADEVFGISLTPAEHARLALIDTANESLLKIEDLLRPLGIYAGAWIDHDEAISIHLGLTQNLTSATLNLVTALAQGVPVETLRRSVSYSDLQAITARVTKSHWWTDGVAVAAGPDDRTGRVEIGVITGTSADDVAAIRQEFGPSVDVVVGASPARAMLGRSFSSGNLDGGEWISGDGGTRHCSVAWSHVRNGEGAGGYYSITAGHCFKSGMTVYRGHDMIYPLGSMGSGNPVHAGAVTNCDCKQFGTIEQPEISNFILGSTNQEIALGASSGSSVGTAVCLSGARSANVLGFNPCGYIQKLNQSRPVNVLDPDGAYSFTLTDADVVSILPYEGDSGGTVYSGASGTNKLYGIMAAADYDRDTGEEVDGVYSEILNIATAGVTVRYN
jgi:hypothetical protein